MTPSTDQPADHEDQTAEEARDAQSLAQRLRKAAAAQSRTEASRGKSSKLSPDREGVLRDALDQVPLPDLAEHFVHRIDPGRHARIELHVKDGRLRRTHITGMHGNVELVRLDERNKRARAKRRQAQPEADAGA